MSMDDRILEKAIDLKEKFGDKAEDVVHEIIEALYDMYIYDNSEAYETREDEVDWWSNVRKQIKTL